MKKEEKNKASFVGNSFCKFEGNCDEAAAAPFSWRHALPYIAYSTAYQKGQKFPVLWRNLMKMSPFPHCL